jgi:molybdopterin molybdotransferase
VASGSPIPRGADAVVLADHVERDPGATAIEVIEPAIPGAYIERRANDFSRGRLMLRAGHRMRAADPALLAVAGIRRVDVVRRPRVRLVVTGADLCQAGQELRCGAVYDADTPMLHSLVERDGGAAEIWPVDRRFSNAVRNAILTPTADVVMVVGGSGLGARDLAVLQALAPQAPYHNTGGLAIHGVGQFQCNS